MIRLKVREIAKSRGIGQLALGRMSNVDANTIRRIYHNPYSSLTLPVLDRLAKALGVDASELIESVPDDTPQDMEPSADEPEAD